MNDTLRALWRDQEARHPEPPTPALIDALYEAGEDELAWRLHWCREWGVVPAERKVHVAGGRYRRFFTWYHYDLEIATCPEFFETVVHSMRNCNWWAWTVRRAYRLLLCAPREVFPCK